VAELVGLGVECIVTSGITEATLAKQSTTAVPLVAILHNFDAVESELVANIARPEGNVTGTAGVSGLRLQSKLPEILKETVPAVSRMAVLASAQQPRINVVLEGVKESAARLGVSLEIAVVQDASGIDAAFTTFSVAGAEALVIINQSIFAGEARPRVASLALAHRLPTITTDERFVQVGGLMTYGVDRRDNYRLAAGYVDKILKGAKPSDLPMERPRNYDLVINLKTAQALGLSIPQSVLQQATEVLQ
jgi:putative ABC transport system substrate-binding protein